MNRADSPRTAISTLLTLLILTTIGWAAPPAEEAESPNAAVPQYSSVRRLPGAVTLAGLSNGLTVIVQENHVAPVATVRCYVKNTGSAFETGHLGAGLSHILEHVVSGGSTTHRSEEEIRQIIDRFGGATNAYTTSNLTAFYIDCPARDTMTCIELVADAMQHCKFEQSEFDREMKVIRREIADGEVSRARVQGKMINQTLYTKSPVRHPVIGYLDVFEALSKEDIVGFYRERYVPNNQVMVVVGDVDTQQVLDAVARQWASTPHGTATFVPLPEEPMQVSPREPIREMDGTTYDLALVWPTIDLSDPDLYALDVAAYILTEGDSSRLIRDLKYDRQLVLSVDSASYTPHFVRGWFGIFATCPADTWKQAAGEILREVDRLRREPVSPEELAKAKKQKAAEVVFGQQTVQQAAESLGRSYLSTGDPLFDRSYAENIQQVTAEQVQRVARKYLVPRRLNRILITPPGGAPERAEAAAGAGESDVRLVTLPNGLRVLVKRASQLPLVNIQAFTLGAALVDTPDTAGRSALVGAMLDKGTADHTARQIADYFDSIGGQLAMAAGRNTVYGSATTLREDFPKAAALFAECFTRPTFPGDEFAKVKQLALGAIAARANSPHAELFELLSDNLPAGSPYHVVQGGKVDTVQRLTAGDLRAYHRKYFVPNNMVVTVFGDVDPDAAIELVKRLFGHLKPDPDFKPIRFDRPNAIPETTVRHRQTGKPTGMIAVAYAATSILDKKDYAALEVLDAITSGYSGPRSGWLFTELRGAGLVYDVDAFQLAGPAPGYFVVYAQTHPDKIGEVVGRIQKNLDRAKAGRITEDEFRRAVEMVISLHAQQNTTIASQAQEAALDELYGLGYDYNKTFDARIQAINVDDVVRAANKYLTKHVLVTTSPEAK